MSTPRFNSATGYYHVIQRGSGKQILFEEPRDYRQYLKALALCKGSLNFELAAYCLMLNHTHLLIKADKETLSKLMQRLGTRYSHYYNGKYDHSGHVFQGRYIAEPINNAAYFRTCIRYIHNNPVKAGYCKRDEYKWSSYNEYVYSSKYSSKYSCKYSCNSKNCRNRYADTENTLEMLGGVEAFVKLCDSLEEDFFLEYNTEDNWKALGLIIIKKHVGKDCCNGLVVQSFPVESRNAILVDLRQAGLSYKKIELLTGVSQSIVRRVTNLSRACF